MTMTATMGRIAPLVALSKGVGGLPVKQSDRRFYVPMLYGKLCCQVNHSDIRQMLTHISTLPTCLLWRPFRVHS